MAKNNDVVYINLGGRERELRFGHKAIKTMQAISGLSIEKLSEGNDGEGGFDFNTLETMIFCGLQSDARKNGEVLKLEDMEDWIDELDEYDELVEKMKLAFEASFGKNQDSKNSKGIATAKKK